MKSIVNNFTKLKALLPDKPDEDTFWVIRIIGRKKDNPNLATNSKSYKAYTVQCKSDLDMLHDKIVECVFKNTARAYFNPNAKSWKKVAMSTLKHVADCISCEQYSSVMNAADKSLDEGAAKNHPKMWVVDIDSKSQEDATRTAFEQFNIKPVMEVPTANGMHFLVNPFNLADFSKFWNWNSNLPCPDIHKNSPTLLYFNSMCSRQ